MKCLIRASLSSIAMASLLLLAANLSAQEPQSPRRGGRGPDGDGPRAAQFGPPTLALREALDKDKDGNITVSEMGERIQAKKKEWGITD